MSKKRNYHTIRYGQKDGELKLGHIHNDDVQSAVLLRSGYDYRHYITLDADDGRKGWTTFRTPGTHQTRCGDDVPDEKPAFFVDAVNGDIILNAPEGRIRLLAKNIDLVADGENNSDGIITLSGNEGIRLQTKNLTCESTAITKIVSSGILEMVGEGVMNCYGGIMDMCDGRSKVNGSKFETDFNTQQKGSAPLI